MNPNDYETPDYDLPAIDPEDIAQEAELLKLQGINPNRSFLYKRASRAEAYITSFNIEGPAEPMPWSTRIENPEAIKDLVNFALTQSTAIAEIIFSFLDNPEEELEPTIKKLKKAGFNLNLEEPTTTPTKEKPLADIIIEELDKHYGTLTIDQIYKLVRIHQPYSSRPEAAARQALRRLESKNLITKENNNVHRIS